MSLKKLLTKCKNNIKKGKLVLDDNFNELESMLYTIPDQTLTIFSDAEATIKDNVLNIQGISKDSWDIFGLKDSLNFSNINISVTCNKNDEFNISANITVKLKNIPLIMNYTIQNGWNLSIKSQNLSSSLENFISLAGGYNFLDFLPVDEEIFKAIVIDHFDIKFDPTNKSSTDISLLVLIGEHKEWEIISDIISVKDIQFSFSSIHQPLGINNSNSTSAGNISGTVDIGGTDFQIKLHLDQTGDFEIEVIPDKVKGLPGLEDIAKWIGGKDLAGSVSKGMKDLDFDKFSVKDIKIGFDLHIKKLLYVCIETEIYINDDISVDVTAWLPDFKFSGCLADGSFIGLVDIFEQFSIPQGEIPDIDITELIINAEPKQKKYSIQIEAAGDCGFEIEDTELSLTDLSLEVDYNGSLTKKTSGSISATFNIAEVALYVSANHPDGDDGWIFSGSTVGTQDINLTDLIKELADLFGINLPSEIPTVKLKNLSMEFNTKTKFFHFHGETDVSEKSSSGINLCDVEGIVDITSEPDKTEKRSFIGYIEGDLTISNSIFKLHYDLTQQDDILKANWQLKQGAKSLGVSDLADAFGLSDFPTIHSELDLGLKQAEFSYSVKTKEFNLSADSVNFGKAFFLTAKDSKGKQGFVFALDYRSDLSLSNLPLIGKDIKPEDSLSLNDILIIVSSSEFTSLKIPNSTFNLPQKISKGVSFNAGIACIDDTIPMSLPLDDKNNQNNNKPVPVVPSKNTGGLWVPINKTLGPVIFSRLGFTYKAKKIWIMIDAGLKVSAIELDLIGLGLGFDIKDPLDVGVNLNGINIDFKEGPIDISGGFLNIQPPPKDLSMEFNGEILAQFETFGISGLGSYAVYKDGTASMFLFAMLDEPLGGPPYFFITGIAGGFGYNRGLKIPTADKMQQFPLVQAALGKGEINSNTTPANALRLMDEYIYPDIGEYWLAAGIRFTTFELLNSFALVTASFGTSFELALLGLSMLDVPMQSQKQIVHAELGMESVFNPDHGTLEISAALTRNSYLLSRHCRLTGGYAFYLWFAKEHSGEFVVTLGGYHPAFKKPEYYPKESRLGFNWPVSHHINIKGGAYFALTPSCVMAGCAFNAVYHVGNLRAWFTAHANFLIDWKPFYYDATIGISVGASYTVRKWKIHHKFKVELGASLHVWGPELAGKVHVHWHVISFSISFGNSSNRHPSKLKWHDFSDSFLPNDQEPERTKLMLTASKPRKKVCSIRVSEGLLKKVGEPEYWIINPGKLSLITHTVIPSTAIKLNDADLDLKDFNTNLGIRPMRMQKLTSEHTIIIEKQKDDKTWQPVPDDYFNGKVVSGTVPSAIWSQDELKRPSADVIKNAAVGLEIQTTEITSHEVSSDNKVLEYEGINLEFRWGDVKSPNNHSYSEDPMKEIKDTIMSDSIIQKRKNILAAVGSSVDVDVKDLALQASPSLFNLGA